MLISTMCRFFFTNAKQFSILISLIDVVSMPKFLFMLLTFLASSADSVLHTDIGYCAMQRNLNYLCVSLNIAKLFDKLFVLLCSFVFACVCHTRSTVCTVLYYVMYRRNYNDNEL